jgi:hypothetical protein
MTTAAHRAPSRWTVAGWNRRAAHALWDARLGPAAAEALAAVRLPAYRALAAFLPLVVLAAVALVTLPAGRPALLTSAALLAVGLVLVALGVRPLRRAGAALRDAVGQATGGPAPLNDGRRFDAWVRRNGLEDRLPAADLAAVLRAVR